MKVYTHFYLMDENTAIGFRWRTLLQYGNLRGSIQNVA